MSEHEQRPALTVGRAELPETITVAEQAKAAGRQDIKPTAGETDINQLRTQCFAFICAQGTSEALAMAKTKADEMIFWLQRHRERAHV